VDAHGNVGLRLPGIVSVTDHNVTQGPANDLIAWRDSGKMQKPTPVPVPPDPTPPEPEPPPAPEPPAPPDPPKPLPPSPIVPQDPTGLLGHFFAFIRFLFSFFTKRGT